MQFQPDYRHMLDVLRNERPARLPIYEHIISPTIMEEILDVQFADLLDGGALSFAAWPVFDEKFLVEDEIEIVVQVNGKLRDRMTVPKELAKEEIEKRAMVAEKVVPHVDGKTVRKVIVVPGKLVNIVAN